MKSTALLTFSWEPDFKRKCDTLVATVSPENQIPFVVRMTGVYRTAKTEQTLIAGMRREIMREVLGFENSLQKIDGVLHCPVVRQ